MHTSNFFFFSLSGFPWNTPFFDQYFHESENLPKILPSRLDSTQMTAKIKQPPRTGITDVLAVLGCNCLKASCSSAQSYRREEG